MLFEGLVLKQYKQRIGWIDISRCLSILIIMYAHVYDTSIISDYFHVFHVPVFFVISGLVWKKASSVKAFLMSLLKFLIIPYLIVGLVSIIAYQLLGFFITSNRLITIGQSAIGLIYANSRTGLMAWNRPLWFIPCLVVTKCIWELISRIKKYVTQYFLVLVVWIVAIVVLNTDLKNAKLPWELEVAVHALPYYVGGVIIQRSKWDKTLGCQRWYVHTGMSVACFILTLFVFNTNKATISFQYNRYGNYWLFVIGAVAGASMLFALSMLIGSNKSLEYIGQNSLSLLLWHKFPILIFQSSGFGKKCLLEADCVNSIIAGFIIVMISVAFSLFVGYILRVVFNSFYNSFHKVT